MGAEAWADAGAGGRGMIIVGATVVGEEDEGKASGNLMEEATVAIAEAGVGGEGLGHVAEVGDSDLNHHGCNLGEAKQDRKHGAGGEREGIEGSLEITEKKPLPQKRLPNQDRERRIEGLSRGLRFGGRGDGGDKG